MLKIQDLAREYPPGLKKMPIEEILALQKDKLEQKQLLEEAKNRALNDRGLAPVTDSLMHEEPF